MATRPGEQDREVRRQRYTQGMCVDCGQCPYSPGRPRCAKCHRIYARWIPGAQ